MAGNNGKFYGNKAQNMDISFEIMEHLGDLREASAKGWTKEVNLVSWNGAEPKVDIRDWSQDHSRMGRGITLTPEEFEALQEIDFTPKFQQEQAQTSSEEDLENLATFEPAMG